MHALLQSAISYIYPAECLLCRAPTGSSFGLCPDCFSETPFITGPVCNTCGVPVLDDEAREDVTCEDCVVLARPWDRARAVFRYTGNARRLVLALKHGDRLDLARAAGPWLAQRARPLLREDSLIVPIPLHPWRQLRRRYNQAAELARALGGETGHVYQPQALRRTRATAPLDHRNREDRFEVLMGAMQADASRVDGRSILLVDDVMTSGATLAAAADALNAAGATQVNAVVLARVEKDDATL